MFTKKTNYFFIFAKTFTIEASDSPSSGFSWVYSSYLSSICFFSLFDFTKYSETLTVYSWQNSDRAVDIIPTINHPRKWSSRWSDQGLFWIFKLTMFNMKPIFHRYVWKSNFEVKKAALTLFESQASVIIYSRLT